MEYKYKLDKIKDIKKDVRETLADLEHKKNLLKYLSEQWETMPKDYNRNQYLKRIHEIISNLKRQKEDIKSIIDEIKEIQAGTDSLVGQIKKFDADAEEFMFKESSKDKVAKEIYKEIQ